MGSTANRWSTFKCFASSSCQIQNAHPSLMPASDAENRLSRLTRWSTSLPLSFPYDFDLSRVARNGETLRPNWFFDAKLFSRVESKRVRAFAQTPTAPSTVQSRSRAAAVVSVHDIIHDSIFILLASRCCFCSNSSAEERRKARKKPKQVYDFAGALLSWSEWEREEAGMVEMANRIEDFSCRAFYFWLLLLNFSPLIF